MSRNTVGNDSSVNYGKGSAIAEGAIALSGKNSSLNLNEAPDPITLSDDGKIIGGDNLEMGSQLVKAGSDYLGGEAVKIGDNSTYNRTVMDEATRSILDQAFTVVGSNAANMMTLAAGRDANMPLADDSLETLATGTAVNEGLSGLSGIFKPMTLFAIIAAALLFFALRKKKGTRR